MTKPEISGDSFEATYTRYDFAELTRLAIAFSQWLVRLERRARGLQASAQALSPRRAKALRSKTG